ncbi:MAG: DUF3472 domain-containing protein [Lentisphaeria bacterium]|nr:DUF3472 domain-containing protein [Lentisphaeria bacterium]
MKRILTSVAVLLVATHALHANYKVIDSSFENNAQFIYDQIPTTFSLSKGVEHQIIIDQLKPYTVTSIAINFKEGEVASEYNITFGENPKEFGLVSRTGKVTNHLLNIDLGSKGIGGRYIELKFKSQKSISISDLKLRRVDSKTYGYSSSLGLKQARSVHLGFGHPAADAIYIEAKPQKAPNGTYFCQLGFNGGYMGIQKLGNGKKICIFSIWDGASHNAQHTAKELRANATFKKEGVTVQRFGGEGSGIKSMMPYEWKLNEFSAYMVTVSPTDQPNRNIYTAFLQDPETKEWFRMASFNAIGGRKLTRLHTFVEDFKRDYKSYNLQHKSSYRNPYYYSQSDKKWFPINDLRFTADSAVSVNMNAKLTGKEVSIETGGSIVNKQKVYSGATNKEISQNPPKIEFDLFPKK